MRLWSWVRTVIGFIFNRRHIERDMEEEFRSHLKIRAADLEWQGLSKAEAERQARIEFGSYQKYKEECREALGTRLLQELAQDVRYALRQLRRSPGFTAVVVVTLALGIGANTAIFSLIDAVMLRSIPVYDPSQLVLLRWNAHKAPRAKETVSFGDCPYGSARGPSGCTFTYPFFQSIRSEKGMFSGITGFAGPVQLVLGGNGPARMVRGEVVSADYFSTLGVKAVIGRVLGPADDTPSASPAIVLSYAFWQSAFGGDRSVVGRTILLNSVPFTIAGVTEQSFTNLAPGVTQNFWLPIAMAPRLKIPWAKHFRTANDWWLVILARLKPGVTPRKAQAAASLAFRNEMLHGPRPLSKDSDDPTIELIPAQQGLSGLRPFYITSLYALMFAVGLILLIACANVAGLLLSRAAGRQKEMTVRLAVGAGRRRIVRQLLTESVLLSLASGALGILFAYWGARGIVALVSGGPFGPFPFVVAPDWRILAFTVAISLLTGIVFGLAPAFRSARLDLTPALKENSQTASLTGRRVGGWFHLGKSLVAVQVVLSMVVLVGAGLCVRTLQNLRDINPGFDTRNLLLFGIDPTLENYKPAQAQSFYRELQARLARLPGVTSASYSYPALLNGSLFTAGFHVEGQPSSKTVVVDRLSIGPRFLKTMRIPLVGGRTFNSEDFQQAEEAAAVERRASEAAKSKARSPAAPSPSAAPPVPMLVNQTFVRKYFQEQNPLGQRLREPRASHNGGEAAGRKRPQESWVIVGIVGDTKYNDLRQKIQPTVYVPVTGSGARFELRTAQDPVMLIPTVRRVVEGMNKNLPLFRVETQSQSINDLLVQQRVIARLSGLFGGLALLLACVGLYGLVSFEVTRRTHEIGVRMALGAERRDVLRMVVGQGLALAVIGVVIGVGAALALTRFLSSLLYGVKPTDPLTFIAVSLILIAVALLACYIPARRAAKVDPMVALRYE